MANRILIIAAHPDDETLGCGASIHTLTAEGHQVHVQWIGDGITSREDSDSSADIAVGDGLRALEILGAERYEEGAVQVPPDNAFDTVPLLDIAKRISSAVEAVKPQVVFTHSAQDLNIDHVIVHRATLIACRPPTSVTGLYSYEVPSTTEWACGQWRMFSPNYYQIVSTAAFEAKLTAMGLFSTESRETPHPRSSVKLRARAEIRGSECGALLAEAFEVIRETRG